MFAVIVVFVLVKNAAGHSVAILCERRESACIGVALRSQACRPSLGLMSGLVEILAGAGRCAVHVFR
jgi:hypothetical protein